jgi:hydrogenase maturation protease
MSHARLLVAGIGNIFFGDDAFGVEVARRMVGRPLPEAVRVVDFGIRGYDLAYALLDGYQAAILVDATARGGPPGSLYIIEPDCEPASAQALDAHSLDPVQVLRFAQSMGGGLPRLLLVGCEPTPLGDGATSMGQGDRPAEPHVDDPSMIRPEPRSPEPMTENSISGHALSPPVAAAVDEAVELIESLLEKLLTGDPLSAGEAGEAKFSALP